MENKIPGNVNVVGIDAQLKENDDIHIVEQASPAFFNIYQSVNLIDAYFCDFSKEYPFYISETNELIISDTINYTTLINEYGKLEGFTQSDIDDITSGNAKIIEYLPWVYVIDESTGEITYSYSMELKILENGNDTFYSPNNFGTLTPTAYIGFDSAYTASDPTPAPTNAHITQYTLGIKPTGGNIIVKAFGLMFNKQIIT